MTFSIILLLAFATFSYGHVIHPANHMEPADIVLEEGSPSLLIIMDDRHTNFDESAIYGESPLYLQHELLTNQRTKRQVQNRGSVSIGAEHRDRGTHVTAEAQANLWRSNDRRTSVDANANYQRQFGGPSGTGRPNYGGGVTFTHRF